jgi:hypothetical protein
MKVEGSFKWLSAPAMTQLHHFDYTSDPEPQILSNVVLLPYAHGQHINPRKHFSNV